MAKVDIIIPAFNTGSYLAAAIESVVAQTFTDWQIIVIDGGSSDGTIAIAESYAGKLGERFRLLHQMSKGVHKTGRGIAAGRNMGILNSSSEFVAFLDSDDIWLPIRLDRTIDLLESDPRKGLVYGRIALADEHGAAFLFPKVDAATCQGRIVGDLYTREVHVPGITVTVRRECFETVGLFDEELAVGEDRDMWLRIAERYDVGYVDEVLAYYRQTPNSSSATKTLHGFLQSIQKHYGKPGCGFWARRIAMGSAHRELAHMELKKQKRGQALWSLCKSLYYDPLRARRAVHVLRTMIGWSRLPPIK